MRQTVLLRMDRMKNGDIFERETNYARIEGASRYTTSSPGRFSLALEVGCPTPKAREKRPGDEVGRYNGRFL